MYSMAACRFILGMLSRMIAISNYWWIYQTSLPRQKSRIVSFPLLCYSFTNILVYIASLYDDGSWWYWRCIAGFPVVLGTILVILDILLIRNMNSVKFWIKTKGLGKTKEIAYKIYNKRTADLICGDFYEVAKLEGPVPGEDGDRATRTQQPVNSLCQEITLYKNQFKHVIIVTFLVCYSYFTIFESFIVLIGSKDLTNTEEVEKAKFWGVFAVIAETLSYLMNSVFDLGKNQRKLLISVYWLAVVSTSLVSIGYYTENLQWARLSSITHGLCIGGIYGAFNPYYLTILPSTLTGFPHIVLNFNNALINQIFPLIFRENQSYEFWATGFGIMACYVFICWLLLIKIVKSTKGLTNTQVIAMFQKKADKPVKKKVVKKKVQPQKVAKGKAKKGLEKPLVNKKVQG
jgi:hypothetical protein